mmetsp:Transcript_59541/g.81357  ORF Transcript_59541/g.81357 Transcript_59541/m.81357 type:complete len:315 (-) Transcript_59541:148-1092(-)
MRLNCVLLVFPALIPNVTSFQAPLLSYKRNIKRRRGCEARATSTTPNVITTDLEAILALAHAPPAVVAPPKKPRGAQPVLVLDNDTLETLPKHVALVSSLWVLSALALVPVFRSASSVGGVVRLASCAFGSVIFSDFFSGIFHWASDNYGNGKTPVFGSTIEAFQGHHTTPWTITHRSFFNNVHKIALAAVPLLLLSMALTVSSPGARLFWVVFFNAQMMSQEFHKLSHTVRPSPLVAKLQKRGIILTRKEHLLHHSSPFEAHYCILTGMCNKALDSWNFWRRLEALIFRRNGIEPNCWKEDETGYMKELSLSL